MPSNLSNQIPIAIIGMGCRLPGADGLEEYWELLLNGRDAVQELPESFLDRDLYYDQRQGIRGKTYSTIGGLVKQRPLDLDLCPLSQKDLNNSDPAHLNMCEVAAAACRHAGYDPRKMDSSSPNTGVFIGHSAGSNYGSEIVFASLIAETLEYLRDVPDFNQLDPLQQNQIIADLTKRLQADRPARDAEGGPALGANAAASLIARTLKLNGPHLVTDAACASSLVALAIGANALQQGEIDLAIVGGASFNKPESLVLFSQARSCSATGSRPFDDNADGLISSEGYVALLLKTLPRALADGDRIQAVIPGIGISTDGRGRSLWAPRKEGQVESMRRAYGQHLDPAEIDFIESHATSTQVGDATEMEAISEFFGPSMGQRTVPIGSVKSNIGHTLETAGAAGLLKAVLAIQHDMVPPTINVRVPNRTVPWDDLPFKIATQGQPLPPHIDQRPRRAAVNAFGIGGLNVHLVVDEFTSQSPTRYSSTSQEHAQNGSPAANPTGSVAADDAIAIIGRGGILPGAKSLDELAALLESDRSMIVEAPDARWHNRSGVKADRIAPRQTPHCRGGYITDYEFDWMRYRIPPKQIANSNPLQFMLLDAARQALAEAGFDGQEGLNDQFDRTRTGVVVGTIFGGEFGHQLLIGLRLPEIIQAVTTRLQSAQLNDQQVDRIADEFRQVVIKHKPALIDETGSFTSSTLASRISKELNLMGGAMAVDAGECSSLAALNVAVNMLRSGTCTHVLCAAAQRSMDLANYETLALQGRLTGSDPENPDSGFTPGEGVAMVLLKPLAQARKDGNPIFGVIRGIGGAFNPDRIDQAIGAAKTRACRFQPQMSDQVQRVLAGSNCQHRDESEKEALRLACGEGLQADGQTGMISQIGNLLGAQGLTSLLRETVVQKTEQLTAINNLAINGQNYHLLFEPKIDEKTNASVPDVPERSESQPAAQRATPVNRLHTESNARIYHFAATDAQTMTQQLQNARADLSGLMNSPERRKFQVSDQFRVAIVADTNEALAKKLDLAISQWQQPAAQNVLNAKGVFARSTAKTARRIAFVFPGQGSQYTGMLKGLASVSPAVRETMGQADRILAGIGSASFAEIAWGDDANLHGDIWNTQISVLLSNVFMYQALREQGIEPDCVCGHSFGEIPALVAANALTLEQAILLTKFRSDAIKQGNSQAGGLLSIRASASKVQDCLARFQGPSAVESRPDFGKLYLTHHNAPEQVVVGGKNDLLQKFQAFIATEGIDANRLNVPQAFHTPLMNGARERFSETISKIAITPPTKLVLSGVRNQYVADPEWIRRQLLDQLIEPVQHVELVERLVNDGFGILVEVGPQRVLTALHRQICQSQDVLCVATDNKRNADCAQAARTELLNIQAMIECEGFTTRLENTTSIDIASTDIHLPDNMLQSSPTSTQRILRFDATLVRRERRRQAASQQSIPKPSSISSQIAASIVRHDATEIRRDRARAASMTNDAAGVTGSEIVSSGYGSGTMSGPETATGQFDAVGSSGQTNSLTVGDSEDSLQAFLIDFVVEQTGYPAEIIDIDWDFEADLGIDSIKKAQLFGELRELFDLDSMASRFMENGKFSLDQFRTLRDVLNLLRECGGKGEWLQEKEKSPQPASLAEPPLKQVPPSFVEPPGDAASPSAEQPTAGFDIPPAEPASPHSTAISKPNSSVPDDLEDFLIDFVVEQTGYPREIIEMDADFEADLGIDSIKKAQLFGELRERFSLSLDRFSGIDRVAFGKIRTLGHVLAFLRSLPEFGSDVMESPSPKLIESSTSQPLELNANQIGSQRDPFHRNGSANQNGLTHQNGLSKQTAPAAESNWSNGQAASENNDAPNLESPRLQEAYVRGLQRGKSQAEEIRSLLQSAVDRTYNSVPLVGAAESARSRFSEEQLSEMQGLADGSAVHVGSIVACNLAALESTVDATNACLLVNEHPVNSPVTLNQHRSAEAVVTSTADPAKSLENSPADRRVTNRYILRTAQAPQRPNSPEIPELNGPAIILGTNPVALALQARIQQLGQAAYCIEPTADHSIAIGQLERIWSSHPVPHLFIATPRDEQAKTEANRNHWKTRRELGVMLPFWFCQKWIQLIQANKLMDDASLLAVISSGGDLGFTSPVHSVEGGGVSGLLKSILIESWVNGFRTTPIKILDAKPEEDPNVIADAVMRELASPNYDTEVSWNGGQRAKVQARVVKFPQQSIPVAQPIARGGHWVCTGGARGITAFVCTELAKRFDLSLSLIGVSPQPEIPAEWHDLSEAQFKQLKLSVMTSARDRGDNPIKTWERTEKAIEIDGNLRQLRAAGIPVQYYSCDVSNHNELDSVLQQIRNTSGPIDAVLHGAGIGKDTRFENKDPEKVNQCISAKVDGALALMELTQEDPLKYFVAFGSISGRFGANGHTDYSLANEMMAKTIGWYRDQRPEVGSVAFHWHAWGDVGMATKPETRLALEMIDMDFMPASEGLEHLINELQAGVPEREILITDDRYCRLFFPAESMSDSISNDNSLIDKHYPLLDRGEIESHQGVEIAKVPLNPTSDPFLREHRLDDRPLLPIVVGLELLAEAGTRILKQQHEQRQQHLEIRDIEALNGLRFHNDEIQYAQVGPDQQSHHQPGAAQTDLLLTADFRSRNGQLVEAGRPYLRGKVCAFDQPSFQSVALPVPDGPWHAVEYPAPGSKFYLGPVLQRLRKIKMVGDTAWGRIVSPAAIELTGPRQSVAGWLIPCAALDACLYATGLLAWFTIEPGTALPAGIGRLAIGRLPYPGEPCLVQTKFQRRDDKYVYFNFTLYGNDGGIIAEAEDYRIVWLSQ